MTMMDAPTPGDGAEAGALWAEADDGTWKPECWSKSPVQLQEEARAMNEAAFSAAARTGGRHSNPPQSTRNRPF